eukprot:358480-Chlamydomonas_euryale.AAC.7
MDPTTASREATPQPEAVPGCHGCACASECPGGRGLSPDSRRGRAPNRSCGAATPRVRSMTFGRRTRRASTDSDGDEERDTAQLELDGAATEGVAEKALPSDGAESEGQEPGPEDDDATPTDDGGTDDDAADVQQLTAIVQRLIAQCQAMHQCAQQGRL